MADQKNPFAFSILIDPSTTRPANAPDSNQKFFVPSERRGGEKLVFSSDVELWELAHGKSWNLTLNPKREDSIPKQTVWKLGFSVTRLFSDSDRDTARHQLFTQQIIIMKQKILIRSNFRAGMSGFRSRRRRRPSPDQQTTHLTAVSNVADVEPAWRGQAAAADDSAVPFAAGA